MQTKSIRFEKRLVDLKGSAGETIFRMENVEVPTTWSQTATTIFAQKYLKRGYEVSIKHTVERMVATWRDSLYGSCNELLGFSREYFHEKVTELIITQCFAPNSPQWFNTGVGTYLGFAGDDNNLYYWDCINKRVEKSPKDFLPCQPHACFILPINDTLFGEKGIFNHLTTEGAIFKYGSGAGSNYSKLRGKDERLSNGGKSSGLLSFLRVFDRAAGAIKSGGTTRRAAKMVTLDIDHPDLLEFIDWKVKEEKKAQALIAAGYSSHYEGAAYETVSGQNSNNSIMITDEFMKAVENDGEWTLLGRVDADKNSTHKARDIWDRLCSAAWDCADPGVQFYDTINDWHTCPNGGPIVASNPCSEYFFLENTACNLASINLLKYYNAETDEFLIDEFVETVRLITMILDTTIDIAHFPTPELAELSYKYRTIGLGYSNLGALLMVKGLPYDSAEGREFAASITALMNSAAYLASAKIAEVNGPFDEWYNNKKSMASIVEKHMGAAMGLNNNLAKAAQKNYIAAISLARETGYSNAQITAIAPTGTIGLLMDCDTTGIEPDFSLIKYKQLSGGGTIKIINSNIPLALKRLGYNEKTIAKITDYVLEYGNIENSPELNREHLAVFDCANKCLNGTRFISPEAHILMMAAVQPHVSGGISKTINFPNSATVDDIKDCYMQAWKRGIKSISIYRDGCKASQPLNTDSSNKVPAVTTNRKVLKNKRAGYTHKMKIGDQNLFLRTGEFDDGSLAEIFIDMSKEGSTIRSMLNCFAISVSIGLQHGVPLEELVEKFSFTKFEPAGFVKHDVIKSCSSIVDAVFRLLSHEYLNKETIVKQQQDLSTPICHVCGSVTTRTGTCYTCLNCGTSLGCS